MCIRDSYWGEKPLNNGINFVGYSNSSSLFGALKSKQIDVLLSNSIDDASEDKAEIVVITHEVNNGDFERSKDEINSLNEVKNIASQLSCI